MTPALALLPLVVLAAAPRDARPEAPKPPLEATRVEEGGAVFLRLEARRDVADIAVRVEPTQRRVEFKSMKAGEVRKVAIVGATAVHVAARDMPAVRLEFSEQEQDAAAKAGREARATRKKKLDRNDIVQVTRANAKQIRECYERQLARNPKLAGKLKVQWTILPSGAVSRVEVKDSTLEDPVVASCVKMRVKAWKFPESGEETSITFPFVFKAQ